MTRDLELLAPAGNLEIAMQAILHGADAVYMGASSHGARQNAANSIDDIRRTVDFAHIYRAKVYVTVNTIVYESELKQVERLITELYHAGVDAIIVQDMGILRMDIPPSNFTPARNAISAHRKKLVSFRKSVSVSWFCLVNCHFKRFAP